MPPPIFRIWISLRGLRGSGSKFRMRIRNQAIERAKEKLQPKRHILVIRQKKKSIQNNTIVIKMCKCHFIFIKSTGNVSLHKINVKQRRQCLDFKKRVLDTGSCATF
jgi:hypothetical protein